MSNIEFSFEICKNYSYFLILSSRNLFYNELTLKKINNADYIFSDLHPEKCVGWHWGGFSKTKLFQYCVEKKYNLLSSAHEGLCFDYDICKNMVIFLNENSAVKNDLFNISCCCEEFALQTISRFSSENKKSFKYLGHGSGTQYVIPTNEKLFVYKTLRE